MAKGRNKSADGTDEPTDADKASVEGDKVVDPATKADAVEEAKDKAADASHQQLDDLGTKIPEAVPGTAAEGADVRTPETKRWRVSAAGGTLPERTVEAADRNAAVAKYKDELGVWNLPGGAEAHPAE